MQTNGATEICYMAQKNADPERNVPLTLWIWTFILSAAKKKILKRWNDEMMKLKSSPVSMITYFCLNGVKLWTSIKQIALYLWLYLWNFTTSLLDTPVRETSIIDGIYKEKNEGPCKF